jgi:hypothetical protein
MTHQCLFVKPSAILRVDNLPGGPTPNRIASGIGKWLANRLILYDYIERPMRIPEKKPGRQPTLPV